MDPQAAQYGQVLAQAVQAHELTKVAPWHSNPAKDAWPAEYWWERFRFAATQANWNWGTIQMNFYFALRDNAIKWYKSLARNNIINNIDDLERIFLGDFAQTANARAAITDVRISQGTDSVINYWAKVNHLMEELELSVPAYAAPATRALCLPTLAARAGAADVAALQALHLVSLQADHTLIAKAGYDRLMIPITRAIFIAGLNPKIQDEVVRQVSVTAREALDHAKKAEREFNLKSDKLVANVDEFQKHENDQDSVNYIRGRGSFRGRSRGSRTNRGGNRFSSAPSGPDKSNAMCFYCNKKGHWQRECHKRQRENGAMKGKSVHGTTGLEEPADMYSFLNPPEEEDTTVPKNW